MGDITVYPARDGKQRVEIYIRLPRQVDNGMQVGVAIDASGSMQSVFAAHIPALFRRPGDNAMEPIVRRICTEACQVSGDGTAHYIYWAVGPGGKEIEVIGKLDEKTVETMPVEGPSNNRWGSGTLLLPPLNHFLEEFASAPWTVLLLITDGVIGDLKDVIARCMEVGWEIVNGKRGKCKFIIVGFGEEVDEEQLDILDNMFDGTELEGRVDLWDGKLAETMEQLQEIWDEVDFGIKLPGNARITDDKGNEVVYYFDSIPQRMEFYVSEGAKSLTLEMAGQTIFQPLE